jgi:hypothetical protein
VGSSTPVRANRGLDSVLYMVGYLGLAVVIGLLLACCNLTYRDMEMGSYSLGVHLHYHSDNLIQLSPIDDLERQT